MKRNGNIGTWKPVQLAGLGGGAVEVLWVTLYSSITATSGTMVARQVAASLWPAAVEWVFAPALGIAIHITAAPWGSVTAPGGRSCGYLAYN